VAVTKTVGVGEMRLLHELGVRHVGENRLEVARPKREDFNPADLCWHMIGNIQRRKARDIVAAFDRVDAVDRLSLAQTLQDRCEELDRTLRCLVEVNVSGEAAKHGFAPGELGDALARMGGLDRLVVEGLMTMAPWGAEETVVRGVFRRLRELAETHGLTTLSMGMTDDYEIAIEEGATEVRVGRALFE